MKIKNKKTKIKNIKGNKNKIINKKEIDNMKKTNIIGLKYQIRFDNEEWVQVKKLH